MKKSYKQFGVKAFLNTLYTCVYMWWEHMEKARREVRRRYMYKPSMDLCHKVRTQICDKLTDVAAFKVCETVAAPTLWIALNGIVTAAYTTSCRVIPRSVSLCAQESVKLCTVRGDPVRPHSWWHPILFTLLRTSETDRAMRVTSKGTRGKRNCTASNANAPDTNCSILLTTVGQLYPDWILRSMRTSQTGNNKPVGNAPSWKN